jgi:Cdc6-like AAA superfamily ATPase
MKDDDINGDDGLLDPIYQPQVSAQHDQVVSSLNRPSVILYGREIEISRLSHAWRSSRPGLSTVVVHGKSGTGKTALVQSLSDVMRHEAPNSVFVSS